MFQDPSINILSRDVDRLTNFYERLGFKESFRTPKSGAPTHVEVTLDHFTIGISTVDAAIQEHGLSPNLDGRPIAIILWTDDTDQAYARLTSEGAESLRPPEDFRTNLRTAWVADPDGNPINLVQRRTVNPNP
jgi:predicted enzyme related to lactoylglutathione lyase